MENDYASVIPDASFRMRNRFQCKRIESVGLITRRVKSPSVFVTAIHQFALVRIFPAVLLMKKQVIGTTIYTSGVAPFFIHDDHCFLRKALIV